MILFGVGRREGRALSMFHGVPIRIMVLVPVGEAAKMSFAELWDGPALLHVIALGTRLEDVFSALVCCQLFCGQCFLVAVL